MKQNFSIDDIARVCYKAHQAFCRSLGQEAPVKWKDLSEQDKVDIRIGVLAVIENPDVTPEQAMIELAAAEEEERRSAGYVDCGPVFFTPATHPSQMQWDAVFRNLVLALMPLLPEPEPVPSKSFDHFTDAFDVFVHGKVWGVDWASPGSDRVVISIEGCEPYPIETIKLMVEKLSRELLWHEAQVALDGMTHDAAIAQICRGLRVSPEILGIDPKTERLSTERLSYAAFRVLDSELG